MQGYHRTYRLAFGNSAATKRTHSIRTAALFAIASIVFAGAASTALAQPAVTFTHPTGLTGLGSTAGNIDYSGTAGHVAANSRGDIFIDVSACTGTACATINNTYLLEIPANGSGQVALVSNMSSAYGGHAAYVDSANNVWAADTGDGQIIFVPYVNGGYPASVAYSALSNCAAFPVPKTQTTTCIVPLTYPYGYIQPADIALDGSGNLYVVSKYAGGTYSGTQYNAIYEFSATSGAYTTIAGNLTNQVGAEIAVDRAGDLFYVDGTNANYYPAGSTSAVSLGTGFSNPSGVTIDGGGNLILTDQGNSRLVEFPGVNGVPSTANPYTITKDYACGFTSGPSNGVGIDGLGNIYYAGSYPNSLCELNVGYVNMGSLNQYYIGAPYEIDLNFVSATTLGSVTINGAQAGGFSLNSTTAASSPSTCVAGPQTAGSFCKLYVNHTYSFISGPLTAALQAIGSTSNVLGSATLYGTGPLGAVNIDPGTLTTIGTAWKSPAAVTTDEAGNIFIADDSTGNVYKSIAGAAPTIVATGFNAPSAIAVDAAENLYVANTGEIVFVPYSNGTYGTAVQIASGLSGATGLAITSANNLFVADSGNGRVLVLSSGDQSLGTNINIVPGTFTSPVAVAVDNLGNLFVADNGTKKIVDYNYITGVQTTLASGLTTAAGIGIDEGGSVIYVDSGAKTITRIPSIGGTLTPASAVALASPVAKPSGLAVDVSGDLFVADPADALVGESNRRTGALAFGNVIVNSTSSPLTATFTNAGSGSLNFYYLGIPTGNNGFAASGTSTTCSSSTSLPIGQSCIAVLAFTPTAASYESWNASLSSSSANGTIGGLNMSGTGVAANTVTIVGPTSVAYGATSTYTVTASTPGTYTVSITGTATSSTSVTIASGKATGSFTLPALGVGSYTLSVTVASVPGTASVVVTQAPLTLTANSVSRIFGAANPTFASTYTGFVNGDTSSVVTGTAPTSTTTATRVSPAGAYSISLSGGTLTATNYTISLVGGTLTVTGSAPQNIVFNKLPNFTHGSSYTLTALTTSGLPVTYSVVSGSATVSGSVLTVSGAGAVTIKATQSGNASYAPASSVTQTFTAQ